MTRLAAIAEAHSAAVIEAGGALCCRAEAFVANDGLLPWDRSDLDEAAAARVIAADAALVEARASVASALREAAEHLEAAFGAVVADTEAARLRACAAEHNRDLCLGADFANEAEELVENRRAADALVTAHLSLVNLSLREADFVADALSSLE